MIKRYAPKFVVAYDYKDEETDTVDHITFVANGYIFPLFKSYTGVELGVALDSYSNSLVHIASPELIDILAKLDGVTSTEDKTAILMSNPELIANTLQTSIEASKVNGLDFKEALLIVARACALPQSEHAEALSYGTELLPAEVLADTSVFFKVLEMCINYNTHAKKNSQRHNKAS